MSEATPAAAAPAASPANPAAVTAPAAVTPAAATPAAASAPDAAKAAPAAAAEPAKAADPKAAEPAKAAETKAPEAKTELTKPVVPEKYDLKAPKDSPLTAQALDKLAASAKERGLSNEQAQAELDRQSDAVTTFANAQKAQLQEKTAAWVGEIQADKEIGGDAFKENIQLASRVVQRFGTEAFNKTLNETGLGNHPELVRVFARIGKEMKDDQLVRPGGQGGGSKRSAQDVLYGSEKEK